MLKHDGTVDTVNVDYYWDSSQWERIEKVVTAYADDPAHPQIYDIRADGSVIVANDSYIQASDSVDNYLSWRVLDLYNEQHSAGVVGIMPNRICLFSSASLLSSEETTFRRKHFLQRRFDPRPTGMHVGGRREWKMLLTGIFSLSKGRKPEESIIAYSISQTCGSFRKKKTAYLRQSRVCKLVSQCSIIRLWVG